MKNKSIKIIIIVIIIILLIAVGIGIFTVVNKDNTSDDLSQNIPTVEDIQKYSPDITQEDLDNLSPELLKERFGISAEDFEQFLTEVREAADKQQ